ncbi:MAG: trigger factor [Ignavibacteriales bacterium]|nr:trigger factor [Ignavibacteriales bacterium]
MIENLSDVSRAVEISVQASEIQHHFDKAYQEYRPKAEIKGFRKGRAPLELIKKLYGDLIEHEALNTVATELYRDVVREKELKPIGDPVIVDMNYKRGEQFRFKVRYDVRPEITLKDYKGIKAEKPIHRVADDEIEEEILRLRRMNSTTEQAEGVADDEYIVTAELRELDPSGLPLVGKKNQNSRFYLADPQLEQPIHDALRNATPGGEYRVSFRHQHGDHAHDVNMMITVSKVEKVLLPEFSDEFVKKVTKEKIATVDEFLRGLRKDLESYWTEKSHRQVVNAIAAEIIRRHDFQVPESLIRSVLQGLVEEVRMQYRDKQLPSDFDTERFFRENRDYAIYQAKWALLREEIINAENISVSEQDLAALAEKESEKIGIDKDRLVGYYKSSEQVKDRLAGDKLVDFLLKHATIKEVEQHNSAE